ncbi:hypothetical protein PR202_ga10011 [Eleusine coracana subsp. coracana]|uniref:SURP motif domain-containing protein n=1 Tax=Eleusine coracana subsp. coracana TaxID=191504 RepID=A0AAV5C5L3_ELECO|nr:hypothetical protein QOZ80_1AG0029890 [Eleusine coracana subsp. coracana]GJM93453.1 hypothetical protein PR202_ga10011 [Eleusine coracana subsp. coracana]
MDLEIIGRHALLFDDDTTAEVVNSGGSLVPWAAVGAADLLLDRHDVRHLLDRVPPRPRRSYSAALLSAPSLDGVSEAELDRERFLDLPADDGGDGDDGIRDVHPSGDGEGTRQAGYCAVPFSYGSTADSDDPNSSNSYYRPSFYVPESLLNKLPPSEKVHHIISRTALFVSQHGGQSEIVLRVKQGSNPTFGFLMPDHHLHSYFRYLVDHPQLLKDGADAEDKDKDYKMVNSDTEHTPSGGALSLLGTAYDSGDEDEGRVPPSGKGVDPDNGTSTIVQGDVNPGTILPDNEELRKDQTVTAESLGKTILMKKNPVLTGNSFVAAQREKAKDATMKSQETKLGMSEIKEMILEPPSFLKRTMEKIVEFILRNGKEFEEKLIDQDRTTGRFPFLLSSNPYHSYYLKMLQETQESKSRSRSPENKDRRNSAEPKDRSPSERKDRKSSSQRKDISHGKERSRSMERPTTGIDACAPDRSSAEPSEKRLRDQHERGKFHIVVGVKKEPPRKVTADEAAAIVMAATRGLGSANDSWNTLKETRGSVHTLVSNDHSSSLGSLSSLQGRDAVSKHTSNSEADTSLTSSGQLKKEGTGLIDDDWIANTIAKAAAVAASKEADSSEATMTKEQKLKAERLRRAKMFASIIKSGGSKMNDLVTVPSNEPAKAHFDDINSSTPGLPPPAKEREGSSVPFEREGSIVAKEEKDSDDEQNRVRKYRKKHYQESDEDINDSEESYKPSRKRHRSEHSRSHSKDVHRHKSHSKDGESRHRRHHHSSSEDEHEHRSSKSRHRHKERDHYDDDDHRRSHRHRKDHRSSSKRNSSSKRKHEDDRDQIEQTLRHSEASPRTSGPKIESEKPPTDTAQSSGTEVPSELRAKIRAMLLETL